MRFNVVAGVLIAASVVISGCAAQKQVTGNRHTWHTHFPFADLNNVQIADLLSKFLKDKGLD